MRCADDVHFDGRQHGPVRPFQQLLLPALVRHQDRSDIAIQCGTAIGDDLILTSQFSLVIRRRHGHSRLATTDGDFLHVGEERGHRVEVALRDRVELVIVALGAAHRRAEPDTRHIPHAIGGVLRDVLLRLRTALFRRLQQPVVARCDLLPDSR